MNYKGIIFDLDGTLINSIYDIADSLNQVLAEKHFSTHSLEIIQSFIGTGIKDLVQRALHPENRDEATILSCLASLRKVYRENCLNKTRHYAGITELLDKLKRRQIKLAILSNKPHEMTCPMVDALLPNYFEIVLGVKEDGIKKPEPKGALAICGKWGIKPEETIFVGDSGVDMQTATNANMFGVGVLWGFRDKDELLSHGAKKLIKDPGKLLDIL